ncbi:DUF1697 domain-containing protein [Nocardioides massiliensis]|uniref:Uncharacterized protein (DUF1697 family) n=1 Tax=Nocardioides massiliensis TaxID=1325935 RepID=A0ABT9NIT0_9ACTN|nr:DUF1697 domain-containing protein [Nocardioides massiliensis]MDP9820323.1 uncharacterized protein (DUF1697 family) [Nocardioides massiliensis]
MTYVVLLRGINVGGRNKIAMAALREHLAQRFPGVRTYIQSGNVLLDSELPAAEVATWIEESLPQAFALDSSLIRALVLDEQQYATVLAEAPGDFGADPDAYRYDVGFYLGVGADDVRPYVPINPEVDEVAFGSHAFYFRRLTALATRSRLNRVIGSPVYASLTIRNWRTTQTLGEMLRATPRR